MRSIFLSVVVVCVLNLAACNTVSGLGKDVEKLGDKIENKADQKKNY